MTGRKKKAGAKDRLNHKRSGRLHKEAEVLTKAVDVFGSLEAAERFLDEPAMALDRQRQSIYYQRPLAPNSSNAISPA